MDYLLISDSPTIDTFKRRLKIQFLFAHQQLTNAPHAPSDSRRLRLSVCACIQRNTSVEVNPVRISPRLVFIVQEFVTFCFKIR